MFVVSTLICCSFFTTNKPKSRVQTCARDWVYDKKNEPVATDAPFEYWEGSQLLRPKEMEPKPKSPQKGNKRKRPSSSDDDDDFEDSEERDNKA